jgi:hypothetical protein
MYETRPCAAPPSVDLDEGIPGGSAHQDFWSRHGAVDQRVIRDGILAIELCQ